MSARLASWPDEAVDRNRIHTLARVAEALDRHPVLSFPSEVPDTLTDAVQVA